MILWTQQAPEVWKALQQEGIYHCRATDREVFAHTYAGTAVAYAWMSAEMTRRIGKAPEGALYPVWAWHTLRGRRSKPDLRWSELQTPPGSEAVLLEVDVPDECVLLSDVESWHFPLNGSYMPDTLRTNTTAQEDDAWEAALDRYDALPDGYEKEKVLQASWQHIFSSEGERVQATIWELRLDQVRSVRSYRTRQNPHLVPESSASESPFLVFGRRGSQWLHVQCSTGAEDERRLDVILGELVAFGVPDTMIKAWRRELAALDAAISGSISSHALKAAMVQVLTDRFFDEVGIVSQS